MDWMQFFGFILTIAGLFLWGRTEANADRRELRASMETMKASTETHLKAIADEMKDFHIKTLTLEKDFHSRLYVLEDRYLRIREKE